MKPRPDSIVPQVIPLDPGYCQGRYFHVVFKTWVQCHNHPKAGGYCGKHKRQNV